jgi:hypothetical protein
MRALVPARLGEPVGEVVHRRGQVGEVGLPVELGRHRYRSTATFVDALRATRD